MTEFSVKLADTVIRVSTAYPDLKAICRDYLTDENAGLSLSVTQQDAERERTLEAVRAARSGKLPRKLSELYYALLALQRNAADVLCTEGTLFLHGAAVAVDGAGYAFSAPSGTGKTTHLRLWRELLGERMTVINGDKPLLRIREDGVTVYGNPWRGKEAYGTNTSAPLCAICFLRRGEENTIRELSPREALPYLIRQIYLPKEQRKSACALALLDRLSACVRFCLLQCNTDPSAAELSFRTMHGSDLPK